MKRLFFCLLASLPALLFSQTETAEKKEFKVAAIGFYNLENLFDTIDVEGKNDIDFTPNGRLLWNTEKYISKQANMARVIRELGTELNPDGVAILGVAEIENRKVLEDLVAQEDLKNRDYKIVQYDSPDDRGIDVALLYNPKYFELVGSKAFECKLRNPKDAQDKHATRDVLLVSGKFDGELIHILVNHWPSRSGGEKRSEYGRIQAATINRAIVDSLYAVNEFSKIVLMGDLNDDPKNASMKRALRCESSPENLPKRGLYNPMEKLLAHGTGTMAYRDAWSLFDQVVVSKPFVEKEIGGWQFYKPVIFNKPWLLQGKGPYKGYPYRTFDFDNFINGYSDHLPVYLWFLKEK